MQSTTYFIVKPKGGQNYVNEKEINGVSFVVNTSIEDAKDTNRTAIVVSLPLIYNGNVKVGDEVIVHHNTFRDFYDHRGRTRSSNFKIKDDLFYLHEESIFLIKEDGKYISANNSCFIEPVFKEERFVGKVLDEHIGIVKFGNPKLEKQGVFEGDKIAFKTDSEYEFELEGTVYYRMRTENVMVKISA